jgi:bacteriorhodopsin
MYDGILMIKSRDGYMVRGAEYLDWIFTVPSMLVVVGTMGRFPYPSIFVLCCLDIFMNVCGLLGAYTCGISRWIYFTMGCFFFLPQWIFFLYDFDYGLVQKYFGEQVAKKYFCTGRYLFLSRMVFPIIWVLEVSRAIPYFTALVMFSIMGLIAKVGLSFWVLACLHESTNPENDNFFLETSLEREENALSVIRSSKSNSNHSSPRSDKKDNNEQILQ